MMEMMLSALLKFRDFGFEHWILVTSARSDCEKMQVRMAALLFGTSSWQFDVLTEPGELLLVLLLLHCALHDGPCDGSG